jgi:hypothetical protein
VKRRPWTPEDDAHLRRFHAEGKTDKTIGYILGRNNKVIWRKRHALGLPTHHHEKAWNRGYSHTEEGKAKIAEANRRRWQDPAYRERALVVFAEGRERFHRERFRRPKDPADLLYYLKLKENFGRDKARQLLAQQVE